MKKCISCKEKKPQEDFGISDSGWIKRECNDCANARAISNIESSYLKINEDAPCNKCPNEKVCGILSLCCKPYRISLTYGARTRTADWIKFPREPDQYLDGTIPESGVI